MRLRWLVSATLVGLVGCALAIALLLSRSPVAGPPDGPAAEVDGADPAAIPWAFFSLLPPEGGAGSYVVQAGLLGDNTPRVDLEVPWAVDTTVDVARTPAVSRPAAGAVLYIADDGTRSTIHRVAVAGGAAPETIATIDETVWSIAAAPDGSAAYLALVVRGRPDADLGVVRVALDGSGAIEPVVPAVSLDKDARVRLVAVAPFTVTLDISADGHYLARTACRGAEGCTTSLVELGTGDVRELQNLRVVDLGTGGTIVAERCNNAGCTAQVIDLATGASVDLPVNAWDQTVATIEERPVLVGIVGDGMRSSVVLTDPVTWESRELYRAPEARWLVLGVRSNLIGWTEGAVLVMEGWDAAGGMHQRYLLVPLDGGAPLELPPPPVRQIGPPAAKG